MAGLKDLPRTEFGSGFAVQATDLDPSFALPSTAIGQGAIVPNQIGVPVRNASGGTITAGTLVCLNGWNAANSRPTIAKADNTTANTLAVYVVLADILNNANGLVGAHFLLGAQNTNAGTVGDPVYLGTAGGYTLTLPTAPNVAQIVGRITVKSATVGAIDFDLLSNEAQTQISTNQILAGSITGALESINAGTRLVSCLLPDTGTVGTIPTTGNVVALVRTPCTGVLAGVAFFSVGSLAQDDTNFITFDITDLGTGGAGSTAMLATTPAGVNTTKITGGQALVANGRELLTPNPSQAAVAGNILRVRATASGTLAGSVAGSHMALSFLPTT